MAVFVCSELVEVVGENQGTTYVALLVLVVLGKVTNVPVSAYWFWLWGMGGLDS